MPSNVIVLVTTWLTNSEPLSIWITLGHPNVPMCCTKHLATFRPVVPLIAYVLTNLEKLSMITRICNIYDNLEKLSESFRRPIQFILSLSIRPYDAVVNGDVCAGVFI